MKRELAAPGFNAMTGYGNGMGMREEFGGFPSGRFWMEEYGCLDAPSWVLAGSLISSDLFDNRSFQRITYRGDWR
ncbi:MAG TPA: hypothetical protein VJ673_02765 [Aromatoleum sp.]|uniref:hypothetical protein n=1 Tax=Aromatoleum sp. TaxID=2307007 RepID=UPI002B48CBE3|nr:hypothetical protein [Aromatoleum sp.]HJV24575.1 hypothetical protein [Aromatoleum sp.]